MPPQKRDSQEEIVRLLVLQLRRTAKNQAEIIFELNRAGFGQTRIGELLGTSSNTVSVALAKAKNRAAKKARSGGKPSADSS